jgi:hypothetical protein
MLSAAAKDMHADHYYAMPIELEAAHGRPIGTLRVATFSRRSESTGYGYYRVTRLPSISLAISQQIHLDGIIVPWSLSLELIAGRVVSHLKAQSKGGVRHVTELIPTMLIRFCNGNSNVFT